jgi:hypothetical protein
MDKDFRGRSILKIITQNSFEPLMSELDPKAENLMLKIWNGRESTKCDGNMYGYSNMLHIIFTKSKKLTGKSVSFMSIITNYFEVNLTVDYTFQYKYRTRAISYYFYKEFFCALCMLGIFQYVNYNYLTLFKSSLLFTHEVFNNETNTTEIKLRYIDPATTVYDYSALNIGNIEDKLTRREEV